MKTVGADALRALTAEAAASARRRKNLNLHETLDDPIQRLCNAFEPGTYLRPHRHSAPGTWELFIVLTGRAAMLTFDDAGGVSARAELAAGGPVLAVEVPAGAWHSLVALAPGTVLFEVKRGPYRPTPETDFASWAPKEGNASAAAFVAWMAAAGIGDRVPAMA